MAPWSEWLPAGQRTLNSVAPGLMSVTMALSMPWLWITAPALRSSKHWG